LGVSEVIAFAAIAPTTTTATAPPMMKKGFFDFF